MRHLKSLVALWQLLATKTQLARFVSPLDREEFVKRTAQEGITYLTTALPALDKALLLAFREGIFTPVPGFRCGSDSPTPLFLRAAWEVIFDKEGRLREPVSSDIVEAARCIRQLCAVYYKLEVPYTEEQEQTVCNAFIEADQALESVEIPDNLVMRFARTLVRWLLHRVDPLEIVPTHGSGSSACGVEPHMRWREKPRFFRRLNAVFPYISYFHASPQHADQEWQQAEYECEEPAACACYVPKDSRGPRLISKEPREMMFIQKGLQRLMYQHVRNLPAIASMIDFTDQRRNRELAHRASIDGDYATLDLKEASDRVSLELVKYLFDERWFSALCACRTERTLLPDGREVVFNKFAPMGSAVCFPIEAICFWSIALSATLLASREDPYRYFRRLTRSGRPELITGKPAVSVFGDDIIVPTHAVHAVVGALESVGLVVNTNKSYWTGPFRESCGGDYLNGSDITPIRWKHLPSDDVASKFRTAKILNNIIARYGYGNVGHAVWWFYTSFFGPIARSKRFVYDEDGNFVQAFNGLALYCEYTDAPDHMRVRYNRAFQVRQYRVLTCAPEEVELPLDRWCDLLNWVSIRGSYERSLQRRALAKRVRYKYSWIAL